MGERVRRIALALTAALVTSRAFWPSEPDLREGAGSGLYWLFVVFVAFGLALTAALVGGRFRFRWSWTDAFVVGLMALVAISASHALDRRPAINLAWEWVGLGLVYLLLRHLPRTREESSTLAGVLVATACAVSAYALYQIMVELPLIRAAYVRNPQEILQKLGIEPGGRGEELFRNRLMYSSEPFSTFGLANSLAGFIVGPLVLALGVAFHNLERREKSDARWSALITAAPVVLVLFFCLILTKSRSAWLGLAAATIYLGWRSGRQVSKRTLWVVSLVGLAVIAVVVVLGFKSRMLDREVLTQSTLSMRYRWEYWQGAWGVITGGATSWVQALGSPYFWWGVGPGNFGGPYLKYKLPQSSEEILDPHNLFLEVWATAGFWAFIALMAALALGLWNLLGRARPTAEPADVDRLSRASRRESRQSGSAARPDGRDGGQPLDAPPRRQNWLVVSAGLGGWTLVVLLGRLNPFEGDLFFRWMILGASWAIAAFLGEPLWRRQPIPGTVLGAGFLAVLITLLAAGGIGVPTVAVGLWSLLALGLNLRDDRKCGRMREYASRVPPFVIAVGWAALLGSFVGLVSPFWRSEFFIAEANAATNHRPPELERADRAYLNAIDADRFFARPWRELASLHLMAWQQGGAKVDNNEERWSWKTIPFLYERAAQPPRNPGAWAVHSERARAIHQILGLIGSKLEPLEAIRLRGELVKSTRMATRLNPTNAELQARLAYASADMSMYQDAVDAATEALRLDRITPHLDKKLNPPEVRERLTASIPMWKENAAKAPIHATP